MFKHKRVAIDFDGTLFEDVNDIEKAFYSNQELTPITGASETTKWLSSLGFEILIFTCRPDYHRKYIENMLKKHNIIHDYILFYTKPRVDLYIDNKGFRFKNWHDTKNWIDAHLNQSQEPSTNFEKTLRKNKIQPLLDFIEANFAGDSKVKILDVGCGSGDVFHGVFDASTASKVVLDAVEPDKFLKEQAITKNVYRTIFDSLDLVNLQNYDIVCVLGVLEHITDDIEFLNSLQEAKSIYLTVPNASSMHRHLGIKCNIIKCLYELSEHDFIIGHKRYYDKQILQMTFEQTSLKDKFIIMDFGTTTFKLFSNSQMQQFEHLTSQFTSLGEQFSICGKNNFFGAEIYCLMTNRL